MASEKHLLAMAMHRAIESEPGRAAQLGRARAAIGAVTCADLVAYLDGPASRFRFCGGRGAVERLLAVTVNNAGLSFAKVDLVGPYFYCIDTRTNHPLFALPAPPWACEVARRVPRPSDWIERDNVGADRVGAVAAAVAAEVGLA